MNLDVVYSGFFFIYLWIKSWTTEQDPAGLNQVPPEPSTAYVAALSSPQLVRAFKFALFMRLSLAGNLAPMFGVSSRLYFRLLSKYI